VPDTSKSLLCGAATVFVVKDGMRDFDLIDIDGNQLCFDMESKQPLTQGGTDGP
jgi:hypothetical protein